MLRLEARLSSHWVMKGPPNIGCIVEEEGEMLLAVG